MLILILKFACLVLAFTYGFTCFGRLLTREDIGSFQVLFMSIGIAGFITLQYML